MIKKALCLCLLLIAFPLMAMPRGVSMTFSAGPENTTTSLYSYFNPMPVGYGNYFPLLCVVMTLVCVALVVYGLKKNTRKATTTCFIVLLGCTPLSWLLFNSFTVLSALIAGMHSLAFILHLSDKPAEDTQ